MNVDIMRKLVRKKKETKLQYLYDGTYKCVVCEKKVAPGEDDCGLPDYVYCPYCGAKIKGRLM